MHKISVRNTLSFSFEKFNMLKLSKQVFSMNAFQFKNLFSDLSF